MCGARFHCVVWSEERIDVGRLISLAGAATSIILFIIDSYVCRDKLTFVETKPVFCRDKSMLVATKTCLSRKKEGNFFVSIKICLSRQKYRGKRRVLSRERRVCGDKDVFVATIRHDKNNTGSRSRQ